MLPYNISYAAVPLINQLLRSMLIIGLSALKLEKKTG